MRFLYFLFLVAFLGAVGIIAYQNQQNVELHLFDWWRADVNLPLLIGAAYVLGMLSGWTVVGMLRRSFSRMVRPRDDAKSR
jgi:uncharacterized integral membrane protein